MTFRNLIEAVIKADESSQSFSDEDNFKELKKDKFKTAKLLNKNIGPDKLNFWEDRGNIFYLSSTKNEYRGFVEVRLEQIPRIVYSHSGMKGGFYKTIFENILKHTKIKELISDVSISKSAFTSYVKLSKDSMFNIQVITPTNEYLPFNKKNLTADEMNRASVKLK